MICRSRPSVDEAHLAVTRVARGMITCEKLASSGVGLVTTTFGLHQPRRKLLTDWCEEHATATVTSALGR